MTRRSFSLFIMECLAASATLVSAARGEDPVPSPGRAITFQETLEKGLKVRTEEERRFITRVVDRVEEAKLSEDLVRSVFAKARLKSDRYPYFYFRQMLLVLAEREGVAL